MASRVAAAYLEVLQTDGAAARVSQVSAEALLGANTAAKGRVSQVSAEALLGGTVAAGRISQVSAEALVSYTHVPGTGPLRFGMPSFYGLDGTNTNNAIVAHTQRFSGGGLLVGVFPRAPASPSNPQTVTVTWNGVAVTSVWSALSPASGKAYGWVGWLAGAAQGGKTLQVNFGAAQNDLIVWAMEVWGYDPAGAIGATNATSAYSGNASATTSTSVTTTAARSMVVGMGWVGMGNSSEAAMGGSLGRLRYGWSGVISTLDVASAIGYGYRATAGSFSGSYTPALLDTSQGLALIEIKADPSWQPPTELAGTAALSLTATGSLLVTPPVPRHLNIAALGLNLTATGTLSMATPSGGGYGTGNLVPRLGWLPEARW